MVWNSFVSQVREATAAKNQQSIPWKNKNRFQNYWKWFKQAPRMLFLPISFFLPLINTLLEKIRWKIYIIYTFVNKHLDLKTSLSTVTSGCSHKMGVAATNICWFCNYFCTAVVKSTLQQQKLPPAFAATDISSHKRGFVNDVKDCFGSKK